MIKEKFKKILPIFAKNPNLLKWVRNSGKIISTFGIPIIGTCLVGIIKTYPQADSEIYTNAYK